jgi:Domain of unknown function (DUF6430)
MVLKRNLDVKIVTVCHLRYSENWIGEICFGVTKLISLVIKKLRPASIKLSVVWHDIIHNPGRFLASVFVPLATMWTLIEISSYFLPISELLQGIGPFLLILTICLCIGVVQMIRPEEINIRVGTSQVIITFGDLLAQEGFNVIPSNNYFYFAASPLANSLDVQLARQIFQTDFDKYKEVGWLVDELLEAKGRSYPIGTTLPVVFGEGKYLIVASSMMDDPNGLPYMDMHILWDALKGLWAKARELCEGHPVNVPLLGTGRAGIGIREVDLIRIIIISLQHEKQRVSPMVRIVIHPDKYPDIDLGQLKKEYSWL